MAPKSVPVPMIRRVRLKNFRSIAECDVELGPLTILVGPNGSGKSNFLHALDFLSDALNDGLETAVRRRGGIDSLMSRWAFDDPAATLGIEIELDLLENRRGFYGLALKRVRSGGYRISDEHCKVIVDLASGKSEEFIVDETGGRWTNTRKFVSTWPVDAVPTTVTLLRHADHVFFGAVYRALVGMSFYSLHDAPMRRPQELDSGERLRGDGSNVASVYERLLAVNEHGWRPAAVVTDALSVVTPGIVSILAPVIDGYQVLRFEQRLGEGEPPYPFNATEMSYGTLRTLGVLVALYQGSMAGGSPVTLVGIEEPESAVHPGIAAVLLEAMQEASLTTQVLATTHSSAMLDYEDLDPTTLRAVAIMNGRTRIGSVDSVSLDLVARHLYTSGELHRMGQIEPERRPAESDEAAVSAPH